MGQREIRGASASRQRAGIGRGSLRDQQMTREEDPMREAFTSTLRGSDPSSFPIAKTDVQRLELMRALSA